MSSKNTIFFTAKNRIFAIDTDGTLQWSHETSKAEDLGPPALTSDGMLAFAGAAPTGGV